MKQIIITTLVIVAIIGGAIFLSNNKSGDDGGQAAVGSNNVFGNTEGVVTLIEYGDFQCPACGQFYPIVKQVKEQLKEDLRFEFKHFPLSQIHPNAIAAHRASQAAATQGKFWEMHDLLYESQSAWNTVSNPATIFEQYATQIGLDKEKYSLDFANSDTLRIINADVAEAKSKGATGTPTFYLDGELIDDLTQVSSVDSFVALIQAKIDAKKGNPNSGDQSETDATSNPVITPTTE